MVRVAILVEQNWNTVPGGTARSVNRLIEDLLLDPTIEMVGVHGRHGDRPTLPLPDGLPTAAIPIPGRLLTQLWNRIDRPAIERWTGAVDVVHAPGYLVPGSSAPGVVTIHDLAFLRNPEWFTPHGVRYFRRFLDRVSSGTDLVAVPSERTADDCRAQGIDDERLRVIPWGSDPVEVAPADVEEVRTRHGVPSNAILYVGTIEPRKNLDGLLAAMRHLPDRRLVVVGPKGWGTTDLGDATVLGALEDSDVAALMAASGVLAYPSHFEGFGLPVLEAMAQGTPVVVTKGTVPADLAAGGGLPVDTTDPEALAGALEAVLSNPDRRAAMSTNARLRSAEFTWAETAQQTSNMYHSLAS